MYCARCGTANPDGAAYCRSCGALLASTPIATAPQVSGPPRKFPPDSEPTRNPLMAGVLNLLFGLGYVYLGYAKVMRLQVAVFVLLMIMVYLLAGVATEGLASLAIGILLAIDGYQKASGLNGYISVERQAADSSNQT